MTGVIEGGWEFVIPAYAITFTALAFYGFALIRRLRDERARSGSRRPTE